MDEIRQTALDRFRSYLERRQYSTHTITSYALDLRLFFTEVTVPLAQVSFREIDHFVEHQHQYDRSWATINRRLNALKHFFDLPILRFKPPPLGGQISSHGPERDYAPDQRTQLEQTVRGVPAAEEALLGTALLGTRVFLCHGGADDRRNDQRVSGASLRAESLGQLSYGDLTTGLGPVSGLSVHMTNPPALAGGCSVFMSFCGFLPIHFGADYAFKHSANITKKMTQPFDLTEIKIPLF
jgi:hypothetical protein